MRDLGVYLEMPSDNFGPGDECYLKVIVSNDTYDSYVGIPLFVVLEIYGQFWFYPSWNMDLDYEVHYLYARNEFEFMAIPEFIWPEDEGSASGLYFYGAMLNREWTDLFGHMDIFQFSYYE